MNNNRIKLPNPKSQNQNQKPIPKNSSRKKTPFRRSNPKPPTTSMSIVKLFSSGRLLSSLDPSKKSMCRLTSLITSWKRLHKDTRFCWGLLQSAIMKNSMISMSMSFLWEATRDMNILRKWGLRLEPRKGPKSKSLSRCRLLRKIIKFLAFSRYSCKTQSRFVCPSMLVVRCLKLSVWRSFSRLIKELLWLRFLRRRAKSECHPFPSKTFRTLASHLKSKPSQMRISQNVHTTSLFRTL